MDVQRAAAAAARARQRHAGARSPRARRWRRAWTSRCQASITHPVKSHTSVPVAASGGWRTRQAGQAQAPRHEAQARWATASALEPASSSRWWPSAAVREALPPRREPAGVGQRAARALHQPAERHARRARRLAAPALHAGVHEADELGVGRRALPLHGPHRGDAAPRRRRLLARDPVGRAVRQAEPAADARGQLVVDEVAAPSGGRPAAAGVEAAGRVEAAP